MKKFTKLKIKEIPIEQAHGGSGSRQMLVKPEMVSSEHWEAMTKGFLKPGSCFDWHSHKDTDEVFIVLKGNGIYSCEGETTSYEEGDVFITHGNVEHKIEAQGLEESEYYFIRVRA
jgi:quercetin dioxygenase-like cupin family protein